MRRWVTAGALSVAGLTAAAAAALAAFVYKLMIEADDAICGVDFGDDDEEVAVGTTA